MTDNGSHEVAARADGPRPLGPGMVVGIGSSAGGLEALQDLVGALAAGGQAAFVVAQHLSPEHRSLLVELLSGETDLSVVEAVDRQVLETGVVYVGPPNHDVLVRGDVLAVTATASSLGPSPSIDVLLTSIADQWGPRGAGVVLSGTGSDGAHGLRALKAAGGLTFAQSPEAAKFDAMPRAAIALGGVDLVLGAHEIGLRLAGLDGSDAGWSGDALPVAPGPVLRRIVTQMQRATGIDFSRYKESTLRRQVNRRMVMRQVDDAEDYLPLLVADPDEARALSQNILVTVTSFFRDPDAFDALGALLQEYVASRGSEDLIRVWVPGCATGEEVYSIAMLLDEALGHPVGLSARVKIFGTDLDETSLGIARRALYPVSACERVSPERRARYLVEGPNGAEVCQDLRDCTVFARHNVGEDPPPFPRLDLISCRNTLIYFTPPLQERVVDLFTYALLPGGLLFLGVSELVPTSATGFAIRDGANRIYVRGTGAASSFTPGKTRLAADHRPAPVLAPITVLRDTIPEQHVALLEVLVRAVAAPCIVLDESRDLVEVVGDVSPYCQVPQGRASTAAISILRPDLQAEARGLLLMTHAGGEPFTGQIIDLPDVGLRVRLQARPLRAGERSLTVLSFLAQETAPDSASGGTERDVAYDREIERLDRELRDSQESMRRSLAELETANEELQASSEELQASSEELQSSYEELETSNEELQATNEELSSLNQQSRLRGDELEMLNIDLENIQSSLSQGMVLVDRDLRVTRFSALAVRVFALVAGDIGQPLLEVPTTIAVRGLDEALHAVVGGGARRALELLGPDVSYLAQVLPYLAPDGRRLGAIITLTDVTELVSLRRDMETTLAEFTQVTDALEEVVWKRDTTMANLVYVSGGVLEMTGWSPAELAADAHALDNCIADEDREAVLAGRTLDNGHWSLAYRLNARDGTQRWVRESASVVHADEGDFVVGTMADITAQHAAEVAAAEQSATFKAVFDTPVFAVAVINREARITMANGAFCDLVGYEPASILQVPLFTFAHPDENAKASDFTSALSDRPGGPQVSTWHMMGSDGTSRWVMMDLRPLPVATDEAAGILILQDITELRDTTTLLSEQARIDADTALINRRAFREALDLEISRSDRANASLALAWVDLDEFKEVNDQHGHDSGDKVLRIIADRLKSVTRANDIVGRIGGDEFAVLIAGYQRPAELEAALERITSAARVPIAVDGGDVTVSASVGVAIYPSDADTSEALLRAADTAMYAAKADGKDTYTFFDPLMNVEADVRRSRHLEITAAIDAQDFELHYQPIVAARDASTWGFEALVRWNRAGDVVSAADFIPFCEDTGLIRRFGPLMLTMLRHDLEVLRAHDRSGLPVCFNMSVQQLEERQLADLLTGWPSPTGLAGLVVEVTESVFLPGNAWAVDALAAFTALGAQISVDDYGSGYSNFRLLEDLSPAYIKLDRSFLSEHEDTDRGIALLRSAIEMTHALDAIVIAEGIEDDTQRALVANLGADMIQGYGIARPMPLPALLAWLDARDG